MSQKLLHFSTAEDVGEVGHKLSHLTIIHANKGVE